MAFSFETFRNFFSGHKPEQAQPSFTPTSGQGMETSRAGYVGSIDLVNAPISELQKRQEDLIDRFSDIKETSFAELRGVIAEMQGRVEHHAAQRSSDTFAPMAPALNDALDALKQAEVALKLHVNEQSYRREVDVVEAQLGYRPDDTLGEFRNAIRDQSEATPKASDIEITKAAIAQTVDYYKDWEWASGIDGQEFFPGVSAENDLTRLLRSQEENIRQEWRSDLAAGRQDQHDLETYFAGKIDQHNGLIEQAIADNPKLQETLPPQINYEQLRSELQQQTQQQKQQAPAHAMEMAI